ncbi:MAG: ParB/RepB/Spo0J family partition protein [Lachnospiraceae bacterium]
MSKFKIDKSQGEIKVGEGLLNEASKAMAVQPLDVQYIDMDLLERNTKNKYSLQNIDELAYVIEKSGGILQPLIVKPLKDGKHVITTGERRWLAAKKLRDEGRWLQWNNSVPCLVRDPENIKLPISAENKEMFSILATNQYRPKTDGDIMMEIQSWSAIFAELRAAGIETIDLTGEGTEVAIKGKRTRDLVADQLHLSSRQVGTYQAVEKAASEELMGALIGNQVNLSAAKELAKLDGDTQKEFLNSKKGEKITAKEIDNLSKKIEPVVEVPVEEIRASLQALSDQVKSQSMRLKEKEYKTYIKLLEQLEKLLKTH